ncbi:hypothetical protein B0T40_09850 [Chromobacterium haemolyticum]|uniref:phage tail protein n=1 Tax=Chromobacterium haemolyticum TaxID=394935 RepID=UPI0009DA46B1|nr:phage tail protein [Chromobacterium haemolyticum]OQS36686.1 hypothetical protein B0T40_09850 [Chromobacterium haemolyticum]
MKRIDTPHSVPDLNGPGKSGFVDLNVATGVQGTEVSAAWLNMLQEEVAGVVESTGLVLSGADSGQLRQAIQLMTVPAGAVQYFAMKALPAGWLRCDGSLLSRATYPALFAAIGTTFGAGDGVTTFGVPDLRGEFVRGWDDGRGVDSGRVLGSMQAETVGPHTHTITRPSDGAALAIPSGTGGRAWGYGGVMSSSDQATLVTGVTSTNSGVGVETRPRNVALRACIKF